MKLELKHIAPYLPYKLMMMTPKHRFNYGDQECLLLTGISNNLNEDIYEFLRYDDLEFSNTMKWVKPILRPLSQLTEEIEVNGSLIIACRFFGLEPSIQHQRFLETKIINQWMSYKEMIVLVKYHFDIFGLIKAGLAIDINETL